MKIKAVIFDQDGVIADSEPLSGKTTQGVLRKHGIEMTPEEKRDAFGRKLSEIVRDVFAARNRHPDMDNIISEYMEAILELIEKELKPIENSIELVSFLKDSGLKVAIATSSGEKKMKATLKKFGIEELFDARVSSSEVKHGKPNPEIFLKTAKKLAVDPKHCAVVEDSTFGIQAAKAAGMFAIAFDSPNTHGQDLSAADVVVDDLDDVKNHVK